LDIVKLSPIPGGVKESPSRKYHRWRRILHDTDHAPRIVRTNHCFYVAADIDQCSPQMTEGRRGVGNLAGGFPARFPRRRGAGLGCPSVNLVQ